MTNLTRQWTRNALVAVTVAAAACSGSGSPTAPESPGTTASPSSGSGGGNATTGTLTINLTDSPFSDAEALLVTFSSVSVHRAEGDSWQTIPFVSGGSRTCDLKRLNGPTDVLGVGSLPTGRYTQVRLVITSAQLYFDNKTTGPICAPSIAPPGTDKADVEIPSGEVKLNHQFTVSGANTTMLLDFDGDQSVRQAGGGSGNGNGRGGSSNGGSTPKYMMSPVIRVVSVQ